ncbi:MAG TPA: hypothetical protein VLJ37_05615 [bacterium]|nr:hypothetical protein [bacterium]
MEIAFVLGMAAVVVFTVARQRDAFQPHEQIAKDSPPPLLT